MNTLACEHIHLANVFSYCNKIRSLYPAKDSAFKQFGEHVGLHDGCYIGSVNGYLLCHRKLHCLAKCNDVVVLWQCDASTCASRPEAQQQHFARAAHRFVQKSGILRSAGVRLIHIVEAMKISGSGSIQVSSARTSASNSADALARADRVIEIMRARPMTAAGTSVTSRGDPAMSALAGQSGRAADIVGGPSLTPSGTSHQYFRRPTPSCGSACSKPALPLLIPAGG